MQTRFPPVLVACLTTLAAQEPGSPDPPLLEIRGGLVFDGDSFEPRTLWVEDGLFVAERPAEIDETIELEGGHVVPPFAEAHTHTLVDRPERDAEFLARGIVYAKVQACEIGAGRRARARWGGPGRLDVALAMAGLTAPDAHPVQIGLRWPGVGSVADLDGRWVHAIESEEDLERRWPAVLDSEPDFVKAFLIRSDEYAERRADPSMSMRHRGMDPALLPSVVERAHADGLRVSCHVRTAADLRTALAAGVDEIAHLPGFTLGPTSLEEFGDPRLLDEVEEPERFLVNADDAALAAARGVVVVTTIGGPTEPPPGLEPEAEAFVERLVDVRRRVQTENLRVLVEAGVTLAIGSDSGEGHVVDEALYVLGLGVLDEAALLRAWCVDTPRSIFPERRIGSLEPGYEASFVVLGANPLQDFEAVRDVRLVAKQGVRVGG